MGCPRQKCWTDSHLLLQGISPDLGSNLHLLPWQGILYHQATREASAPITSSVSLSLSVSPQLGKFTGLKTALILGGDK